MQSTEVVLTVIAVLCVVAAFMLVAAETAIGRVSRTRVEELARERPGKPTERLRAVIEQRRRLMAKSSLARRAKTGFSPDRFSQQARP